MYSGVLGEKLKRESFMFTRTKRADAINEKRRTTWWCQKPVSVTYDVGRVRVLMCVCSVCVAPCHRRPLFFFLGMLNRILTQLGQFLDPNCHKYLFISTTNEILKACNGCFLFFQRNATKARTSQTFKNRWSENLILNQVFVFKEKWNSWVC